MVELPICRTCGRKGKWTYVAPSDHYQCACGTTVNVLADGSRVERPALELEDMTAADWAIQNAAEAEIMRDMEPASGIRSIRATGIAAREMAHTAYHAHKDECGCRTVGCLTAFIADAVLRQIHPDWDYARYVPEYEIFPS